jgi:hypothetical protein
MSFSRLFYLSVFSVVLMGILIVVNCSETEEIHKIESPEAVTDTLKSPQKVKAEVEEEGLEKHAVKVESKLEEILTLIEKKEKALAFKEARLNAKESRLLRLQIVSWIILAVGFVGIVVTTIFLFKRHTISKRSDTTTKAK